MKSPTRIVATSIFFLAMILTIVVAIYRMKGLLYHDDYHTNDGSIMVLIIICSLCQGMAKNMIKHVGGKVTKKATSNV